MLQLSATSRGGQGSPPCCGFSRTSLVVVFVPLPHVTVQSLHGSQESTLQLTGAGEVVRLLMAYMVYGIFIHMVYIYHFFLYLFLSHLTESHLNKIHINHNKHYD